MKILKFKKLVTIAAIVVAWSVSINASAQYPAPAEGGGWSAPVEVSANVKAPVADHP